MLYEIILPAKVYINLYDYLSMEAFFMTKNNRSLSIIVSILVMLAGKLLPGFGGISDKGVTALALVAGLIILIAAQALPTGVICFICIAAQPLLGLTESLAQSAAYWANYLFFFVMMAFVIGIAFGNTSIIQRVLGFLLKHTKRNARGPVFAIWLTTALLSGIIANFAIIALMLSFCWEYLDLFADQEARRKTGRCLLIGMCAATELGGNLTPLGSSINVMVMNFLEQTGYKITFAQWILISIPLFMVLFLAMTQLMFCICKPAPLKKEEIELCIRNTERKDPLAKREYVLIGLIALMMLSLLLTPYLPFLKTELIIVITGIVLMLPGLKLASYEQLAKSEAFTQSTYICCFVGLASILNDTGVVTWVTEKFKEFFSLYPHVFLVVAALCVLTIILCNFLPAASVPSVLCIPMIGLAAAIGIPPVLVIIPLAMCSNCSWILPLDPIAMLTFGKGYYTLADMVKPGIALTVTTAVITGGWMWVVSGFI